VPVRFSGTSVPVLSCSFYRTEAGTEPVREWLRSLQAEARKTIGRDIQDVQWRWPISRPLVDGLGAGLYEVRTTCERTEYRVLFCIEDSTMYLLHGFVKKSRRTPRTEVDLARRRQKAVEGAQ
jgi:phage-related protein